MFESQALLSRKGALRSVWEAAYFHRKLKKGQVTRTNISSSVDKILVDEIPVLPYRILGYILLGVVRIYSKKVEYLFDDCQKMLIEVKDFAVGKQFNADTEVFSAPSISITLPKTFELDAFDLGVLEDVGGGNVRSQEEITLQDPLTNEEVSPYFLDQFHFEEVASHPETCSTVSLPEDFLLPHLMDPALLVSSSCDLSGMEKFRDCSSSRGKCLDFQLFHRVEIDIGQPFDEEHHINREQTKFLEMTSSENKIDQVTIECASVSNTCDVTPQSKLQVTAESLKVINTHDATRESMLPDTLDIQLFHRVEMDIGELYDEEHHIIQEQTNLEQTNFPEMTSSGNKRDQVAIECASVSNTCVATPQSKLQVTAEGHKVINIHDATPESTLPDTSGSATSEFIVVRTPKNKEHARIPRKRKCLFDEKIVLSNEFLKKSIHCSSDLIRRRRKIPRTAYDAWKFNQIANLSEGFLEALIPSISLELRPLFYREKLMTPNIAANVEAPDGLVVPGSPTVDVLLKETAVAPVSPTVDVLLKETVVAPGSPTVDVLLKETAVTPGSPTVDVLLKETAVAPQTPVIHSKSIGVRVCDVHNFTDSVRVAPASSFESSQQRPSSIEDLEFDILMNEEVNSCEVDNQKANGWSDRTGMVARYLCRSLLNQKKQRDDDVLPLSQILMGRTKKETARLFYEILVLKSTEYVDVEQNTAYGDICVKLFEWKLFPGS